MKALIDKVFSPSQSDAIRSLWEDADKDIQAMIKKEIGKELLVTDKVLEELPLTQLMFMTSTSDFASSQNECVNIAAIIYWGINKADVLPMITEHQGKELASRCLLSLGLFMDTMTKMHKRRGAPSPDFYRNIGIAMFNREGLVEVGAHFRKWEEFIRNTFSISSLLHR